MTRRYFAFTSPAAVVASRTFLAQRALLKQQGKAIADAFGGSPLYSTTLHGNSFLGLRFTPPMEPQQWTVPDPLTGVQRPRVTSGRRGAALASQVELRARFEALKPTAVADLRPVYAACGLNSWGDLPFGGVGYHCAEDGVYLATELDLSHAGSEITGSQFDAAVRRSDA
ncbi:hypothetical protein ABZR86_02395 [Dyella marensis]|uniref:Uncharacterized protein n=1 Tax=Dyella marensis TaxID=500610 RepID=A0A1I2A1X1_9GAMM|nr:MULTISPECIES: hypothetical protein [Dyella]SFE37809.1 hypothetical protein SAMN02799615_00892 [Dyella marensis]